jgi:DNA-binding GntR family transcriptional regulator
LPISERLDYDFSDLDQGETLTDRAYRALEEEIVTLRLAPGSVVSEALLSRRLAVGRTPVREALQRLNREGLVTIMPRRGVVISDIDVASQLRLLDVRRELERLMVKSAARRSDPAQRRQFAALATGMERAARKSDDLAFMRLDREYNLLLLDASQNEFAASAMGLLNGLSRRFWYAHYQQSADLPLAARLHADIATAIAGGDPAAAAASSDRLVSYIEAFARKSIE